MFSLEKRKFAIEHCGEICGPFDSIKEAAEFAEECGIVRVNIRPMTSPEAERKARAEWVQSEVVE